MSMDRNLIDKLAGACAEVALEDEDFACEIMEMSKEELRKKTSNGGADIEKLVKHFRSKFDFDRKDKEMVTIRLIINKDEDRANMVVALTRAGFRVWIEPEKEEMFPRTDYYVCFKYKER